MSTEAPVLCSGTGLIADLGGRAKLRLPDFALRRGECLAVVGRNGAGKSTLCRVIAGLQRLHAGAVSRSADFASLPLAYLGQHSGLYPELTVGENIEFHRALYGRRGPFDPRLHPELWQLGLEEVLNKPVAQVSGGFARLTAVAAVLLTGAEVLILDEPFSGLDKMRRCGAAHAIAAAAASRAIVVITAHEHEEIAFATRALVVGESQ